MSWTPKNNRSQPCSDAAPVFSSRPSRRAALAGLSGVALLAASGQSFSQTRQAAPQKPSSASTVDLLLVLAVDASGSVSEERFSLQRQGYATAFRSKRVFRAIRGGMVGAIGVTMVQWTGPHLHVVAVPWTRVDSMETIQALAAAIEKSPRELFGGGTSISGAIDYSRKLLAKAPWKTRRKVIDVSGDGYNSSGRGVHASRDEAVKAGVIINGLPILSLAPGLARHFADDVIGGPGSFSIPAPSYEKFAEAIQRKLVLEIAHYSSEKLSYKT